MRLPSRPTLVDDFHVVGYCSSHQVAVDCTQALHDDVLSTSWYGHRLDLQQPLNDGLSDDVTCLSRPATKIPDTNIPHASRPQVEARAFSKAAASKEVVVGVPLSVSAIPSEIPNHPVSNPTDFIIPSRCSGVVSSPKDFSFTHS